MLIHFIFIIIIILILKVENFQSTKSLCRMLIHLLLLLLLLKILRWKISKLLQILPKVKCRMSKCVESWHNLELSSGIPMQGGMLETWSGFRGGMSSDVLTAMRSGLKCASLPRVWATERKSDVGNRHVVSGFLWQATKNLVEVPNFTNAVEVSKFYRGPEMRYWGLSFLQATHHSVGRLSAKGNRREEVIIPVPWAHYRSSIK